MVFSVCLLSVPCFGFFFLLNLSGFVYIFWVSAIMILGISYGARINMPWFGPICSAEFLKPPQSPLTFSLFGLFPLFHIFTRRSLVAFSSFFGLSRGCSGCCFFLLHFLFGLVPVVYSIQYI